MWHPVSSHWVFKLRRWSFRRYMAGHVATMGSKWATTKDVIDTHVNSDETLLVDECNEFNPLIIDPLFWETLHRME